MATEGTAKHSRAGLSLYANLLDSSASSSLAPGTISRAPVVFKQSAGEDLQNDEASAQKQSISAASLRFQPTKRPQLSAQKQKPKSALPKSIQANSSANAEVIKSLDTLPTTPRPAPKNTLADWATNGGDEDINGFFGGEKRQRGGRKKRKKNKEDSHIPQNWDDIYDPSRPNSYEEYKNSDEKVREVREWKNRLYAHRMARIRSSDTDSAEEGFSRSNMSNQFAPPAMSFGPPPDLEAPPMSIYPLQAVAVQNNPTGEDAYARRMRLSQIANKVGDTARPLDHHTSGKLHTPPLAPPSRDPDSREAQPRPHLLPSSSQQPPPTISRAPVRYNLPAAPSDIPGSEAELESALQQEDAEGDEPPPENAPRSLRPGQKGFAERLMSKYGWTKGSGLGASGSGIVNPLRVQVEKQKKKSDYEGSGFVGPGGRGKIIGGKRKGGGGSESEVGKFGAMSEVVVLNGMVDGIDLVAEVDGAGDGGLMQEIGDECGEKYGRVERVFIDRTSPLSALVFVKFTSQLSALRAVNALEGRTFNGNIITAKFFDADKFETGTYV